MCHCAKVPKGGVLLGKQQSSNSVESRWSALDTPLVRKEDMARFIVPLMGGGSMLVDTRLCDGLLSPL